MAAQKLSVALEQPVFQAARQAAERRGMSLSAWLNEASRNALAIEDGLIAVTEWEAEHGQLTAADLAAVDEVLNAASVTRAA
jgi:urease accessory protein UreF